MLETLTAEIADREQILTAEERRVFNDALVEEIADHLRHRIHEVRGRVEQMNTVLRAEPDGGRQDGRARVAPARGRRADPAGGARPVAP